MPSFPPSPGTAFRSTRLRWLALALLLACGCSTKRMPLAPASAERASLTVAGGNGNAAVEITLSPDADLATVASAHHAILHGNASWRCATLVPADGQTSDALIAELSQDGTVESA